MKQPIKPPSPPKTGSTETTCPHCGKPAIVSPSNGLWCPWCIGGKQLRIKR